MYFNHLFSLDMSHDDVMTVYHLLEPLFIFPDANVRARLGPDDVQRTVSRFPLLI